MRCKQQGLSLIALIIGLIVLAFVALFAMKVIPSYLEFRSAKNAIDAIARERPGATVADIRRAFDNRDRKSTRLNSSHVRISYAVFCLKKKKEHQHPPRTSWQQSPQHHLSPPP